MVELTCSAQSLVIVSVLCRGAKFPIGEMGCQGRDVPCQRLLLVWLFIAAAFFFLAGALCLCVLRGFSELHTQSAVLGNLAYWSAYRTSRGAFGFRLKYSS